MPTQPQNRSSNSISMHYRVTFEHCLPTKLFFFGAVTSILVEMVVVFLFYNWSLISPFVCSFFTNIWVNNTDCYPTSVMLKLLSRMNIWCITYKIAHRRILPTIIDDKSTLAQVVARCRQETSHYKSQCWPLPMSPCDISRQQWVNTYEYTVTLFLSSRIEDNG